MFADEVGPAADEVEGVGDLVFAEFAEECSEDGTVARSFAPYLDTDHRGGTFELLYDLIEGRLLGGRDPRCSFEILGLLLEMFAPIDWCLP